MKIFLRTAAVNLFKFWRLKLLSSKSEDPYSFITMKPALSSNFPKYLALIIPTECLALFKKGYL